MAATGLGKMKNKKNQDMKKPYDRPKVTPQSEFLAMHMCVPVIRFAILSPGVGTRADLSGFSLFYVVVMFFLDRIAFLVISVGSLKSLKA